VVGGPTIRAADVVALTCTRRRLLHGRRPRPYDYQVARAAKQNVVLYLDELRRIAERAWHRFLKRGWQAKTGIARQ